MANLHGKGSTKGRDVIVVTHPNRTNVGKEGKTKVSLLEVQINQSNLNPEDVKSGAVKADTNPYLVSQSVKAEDGGTFVSHTDVYSHDKQLGAIEAAAGDNYIDLENGGRAYAVKADIMIIKDKETNKTDGIKINTKTVEASDMQITPESFANQKNVVLAAREARDAQKAATAKPEVEAKAVEAEVEAQAEAETEMAVEM